METQVPQPPFSVTESSEPPRPPDRGDRWSLALPALAFLALALWSWARWPDPIVDFGQQLYVAWRLAEGEVLYRDLAYLHGPLSAHLHALLFHLFGARLWVLALFNHLLVAAVAWLWWKLLRPLVDRLAAVAGVLVFLALFAFAQLLPVGNYNWITPYTYEITHGIALSLAALLVFRSLAFRSYAQRRVLPVLAAAGALLGLVFLTKTEVFLACALALAAGLLVLGWQRRSGPRRLLLTLLVVTIASLLPPLLAALLLSPALGWTGAWEALLSPYLNVLDPRLAGFPLYTRLAGVDRPGLNALLMLRATGWVGLSGGVVGALSWVAGPPPRPAGREGGRRGGQRRWLRRSAGLAIAAFLGAGALNLDAVPWLQLARPLPFVLLGLLAWSALRLLRWGGDWHRGDWHRRGDWHHRRSDRHPGEPSPANLRGRPLHLFVLVLFSLALLGKMILSARLYHYGFALAMPGTVLLVALTLDRLPAWLERRRGSGRHLRWGLLGLVALALVAHLGITARHYASRTVWIDTGLDGFWADRRGVGVNAAVSALERLAAPEDTVLVVPDGILISYLARRPSPVPYLNWVPTEVLLFGEDEMLEDLRASPPDWVVVVEKNTAELGAAYFGQDYARRIGAWIEGNYQVVGGVGAEPLTGEGFGVRWLRRQQR